MFFESAHKKIQQTSCGYYSQFVRQGGIVLTIVAYISIFYFGAIFGSFFTVLGTRIPIKENFTTTRSHCVACQHTLEAKDLFPIFSYVSHRGKCAYCAAKIDALYFTSEIISGFVACLLYYFYATDLLQLVALAFVFSLLLVIAIADYLYLLIPDRFQLLLLFRCRVSPSRASGCGLAGSLHQFLCDFLLVVFHKPRSSGRNRGRRCQTAFDLEPHFRVGAHPVHHPVGQLLRRLLFSAHTHGERQLLTAQIAVRALPRRFCCRGALRTDATGSLTSGQTL